MKQLLQNQEFQLDEILFQGRNKSYGAYDLRYNSDRILTKALFVGVTLFGLLAAAPFALNALQKTPETVKKARDTEGRRRLIVLPPDQVKPPVQTAAPQIVKTYNSQVPTPARNVVKDTPAPNHKETENAVAGTENISGPPAVHQFQPPVISSVPGNVGATVPVQPAPAPAPDAVASAVDVEASFAGGIQAFRNKMVQNFNTSDFDGSGDKISTVVTFIVEKDGSISNIKATGNDAEFNREAERTIRKIKGKWTPAKLKGESVRSYFKFPVTMMFE